MKKYIFSIFIIALFSACDIDLKPESQLTYNGFWDTEEAVIANHTGIYSRFRAYNANLWRLGELRSDIWGGKTQESSWNDNFTTNNISTTLVPFGNWGEFYGMIHFINDFIKNAPDAPVANQEDKDHMLGQVYGLRAYVYYTMLKTWGKVPISLEPLQGVGNPDDLRKPRASKEEVLSQIKSDIEKSLEYFGDDNTLWNNSRAYWSKPATLTLKGDVYIWSGSVAGGGSSDFQTAKSALQEVTGFSLVDTYSDLWGQSNQDNEEFIFVFDYQIDQAQSFYNGVFTGQPRNIWSMYDSEGNSLDGFNATGANRYGPSEKVVDLFLQDKEDKRGRETFIFMFKDDNGNQGYSSYDDDKYSGAILNKFLGEIVDGSRASYTNVPIYRYADVLLLLAEAKNNLNEDPSTEINKVRERAYAPDNAPAFVSSSKDDNTRAILDERLKEFVAEGKRWWDLLRAGNNFKYVFEEVSTLSPSDAYKIYLPVTQDMLNNDDALEQTEGY